MKNKVKFNGPFVYGEKRYEPGIHENVPEEHLQIALKLTTQGPDVKPLAEVLESEDTKSEDLKSDDLKSEENGLDR